MWRSVFVRVQPFLCNMCSGDKSVCFAPGNTVNSRSTPKMLFPPLTVPFPHIGPRFESWWTSAESFKCAQNLFQKLEEPWSSLFNRSGTFVAIASCFFCVGPSVRSVGACVFLCPFVPLFLRVGQDLKLPVRWPTINISVLYSNVCIRPCSRLYYRKGAMPELQILAWEKFVSNIPHPIECLFEGVSSCALKHTEHSTY